MNTREYIREEGRQEGIQKGIQQGMQQVVLNMLKEKAELSFVSKVTGLSDKEIKKIQTGG